MEQTRKRSKKRDAILSCLCSTDTHPSAEWIYHRLKPQIPDLSLATVYRNLALFKREGRIVSVGIVQNLERFDANTQPHAHFICTCVCPRIWSRRPGRSQPGRCTAAPSALRGCATPVPNSVSPITLWRNPQDKQIISFNFLIFGRKQQ